MNSEERRLSRRHAKAAGTTDLSKRAAREARQHERERRKKGAEREREREREEGERETKRRKSSWTEEGRSADLHFDKKSRGKFSPIFVVPYLILYHSVTFEG